MNKIATFLILITFIWFANSCTSARKHYIRGEYDRAIAKATKKIRKKPSNVKMVDILVKSFQIANKQDRDQINLLKLEGSPDKWETVFALYNQLRNRQNLVKTIPRLKQSNGQLFMVETINYDEEIVNAKNNAAEYNYTKGVTVLKRNTRESGREAYMYFQNVKQYFRDYKDIDAKIQEALAMGTSYVVFKMDNKSGMIMPKQFEEELLKISMSHLNRQWLQYHTQPLDNFNYDFSIIFTLRSIDVSPEGLKEVHFTETKEIPDGFNYVLDAKGNVKKDSLGNDIKVPKFKTISCKIVETQQRKASKITGTLDFYDNNTNQLIKTEPLLAESIFENFSAIAIGDIEALKPETKKKLNTRPLPFPSNPDMIMQCNAALKNATQGFINANSGLFR